MNKFAAFAGGLLFGTAGLKILSSRDAKKVYVHTTAAVLRAKDCVMAAATSVKEGAEDIYADAKALTKSTPLRMRPQLSRTHQRKPNNKP